MKHLLSIRDLSAADLKSILASVRGSPRRACSQDKGVALYFEKPSARTRNSMELAAAQLGGHPGLPAAERARHRQRARASPT